MRSYARASIISAKFFATGPGGEKKWSALVWHLSNQLFYGCTA